MTTYLIAHAISLGFATSVCKHSQLGRNPLNDRIRIPQHLVVPEAQDTIPDSLQELRPLRITFSLLGVLASVDFDHDLERQRAEVNDVVANGLLAPEPYPGDLSTA
jgi:hypothetical protein